MHESASAECFVLHFSCSYYLSSPCSPPNFYPGQIASRVTDRQTSQTETDNEYHQGRIEPPTAARYALGIIIDNTYIVYGIMNELQWNLRITDTLGAGPLSVIRRCPYLGGCY